MIGGEGCRLARESYLHLEYERTICTPYHQLQSFLDCQYHSAEWGAKSGRLLGCYSAMVSFLEAVACKDVCMPFLNKPVQK